MENTLLAVQGTAKKTPAKAVSAIVAKGRRLMITLSTMVTMTMITALTAFADGESDSGIDPDAGVDAFNKVIEFFASWIGRIGLVVGFIGAIMFALAIKNDDAEAKTRGLMTLAAGFVVFAVTKALDLFMGVA